MDNICFNPHLEMQKMRRIRRATLYVPRGGLKVKVKLKEILERYGIESMNFDSSDKISGKDSDITIIVGTDSDLLGLLQTAKGRIPPIFHISPPAIETFFSSVNWENMEIGVERIVEGDFKVEDLTRIKACIEGSREVYALNEIALFASKSALLVEYALEINGESIWRDLSDGVIVSTPTGSTAYAYSVGGPIISREADVLAIIPVNSLNPNRRALIVPDNSRIILKDINSRVKCEIIADGITRYRVNRRVEILKAENSIKMVRLMDGLSETIRRKIKLIHEVKDMPPSAKFVLKILEIHGELSMDELEELTGLPKRTIRYALSLLTKRGLVNKIYNLRDARRRLYKIARI
ncbi:MAG TPA: N-acetylmuramoyl-L-alanine amidase [Candidatus Bathyarchaeota archaeon]|nr:N-acetylmuramoyl-L-alanine amidase [Candidatus Bathyarchaeota archaeon]